MTTWGRRRWRRPARVASRRRLPMHPRSRGPRSQRTALDRSPPAGGPAPAPRRARKAPFRRTPGRRGLARAPARRWRPLDHAPGCRPTNQSIAAVPSDRSAPAPCARRRPPAPARSDIRISARSTATIRRSGVSGAAGSRGALTAFPSSPVMACRTSTASTTAPEPSRRPPAEDRRLPRRRATEAPSRRRQSHSPRRRAVSYPDVAATRAFVQMQMLATAKPARPTVVEWPGHVAGVRGLTLMGDRSTGGHRPPLTRPRLRLGRPLPLSRGEVQIFSASEPTRVLCEPIGNRSGS